MTRKLTVLLVLALLLAACSMLPGSKSDPAPTVPLTAETVIFAKTGISAPTVAPATSVPTPSSTPTSVPTSTTAPPMPLVQVTGPGTYPGDLPYLAVIEAHLSQSQSPVVVEADCQGTLRRQGTTSSQTLHPGQSVAFFFVIPPGHTPDCRVDIVIAGEVAKQECGQWAIALGVEEPMTLTCAVEQGGGP